MKDFIKRRHLIPVGIWLVIYLTLFILQEIFEPEKVHLIVCGLDRMIPCVPAFIYPYLSWFPYIGICGFLAIRNLSDEDYKKALLILMAGMNIFLLITYLWPTGLDLREGLVYGTATLSGWLMQFVQTVDTPKGVFPSMHVYVTLALQYTLEMQKDRLPVWGIWLGRIDAVLIILSTMFTRQHSVIDVIGSIVMFAGLLFGYELGRKMKKQHRQI